MAGKCARSLVVAVGLSAAVLAPRAARADEAAERIALDTRRLEAQELVKRADQKQPNGDEALYLKAAEIYESAYRTYCGRSGPANRFVPDARICEELVYNAARAFRAGNERAKTIGLYRVLIADDERTRAHSPLAEKTMYQLGAEYHALTMFEQAADWYERFATLHPQAQDADAALKNAVILRLGLAQDEQAITDANTYVKNYAAKRPAEAATVMFALAAYHEERGAWERARTVLTSSMSLIDRAAVDIALQSHVLLARVLTHGPTPALANDEYAKARAFWKDPERAQEALRHAYPSEDEGTRDRRLAKCLNAVGEAMFAEADARRIAEVEPLKVPVFTDAGNAAGIQAHVQNKLRPWFEKKKKAIEGAEAGFVRILDLKPVAPPRWIIASGGTVGTMWGSLADDLRGLPVPAAFRNDRILRKAYLDALEDLGGSIRAQHAKPAMMKCLDLSVKLQFQDAGTGVCERWLTKNYKDEFHVVDEIVPVLRKSGAPVDMAPFTYEGASLRH